MAADQALSCRLGQRLEHDLGEATAAFRRSRKPRRRLFRRIFHRADRFVVFEIDREAVGAPDAHSSHVRMSACCSTGS